VLEIHHTGPNLGDGCLGNDEGIAIAVVEPDCEVPCELEVLALVVANRYPVGVIEEDVRRHERRVREQTGRDELGIAALVLELGHPPEFAECRRAFEDPREFCMFGNMALDEQRGALWVDTYCKQEVRQFERTSAQFSRILWNGEGVKIHNTEDGVGVVLIRDPVAQGAQEIAELDRAGGFDAREHTCHEARC